MGRPSSDRRWLDVSYGLIQRAETLAATGEGLGLAIVHRAEDRPIGSTGCWNVAAEYRRLEKGMTWITHTHQRTTANTGALLRIGASEEGRRHLSGGPR